MGDELINKVTVTAQNVQRARLRLPSLFHLHAHPSIDITYNKALH